jgi:hypothetical protein
MDLHNLKGKTLDEATHAALVAHVAALSDKADGAAAALRAAKADGAKALRAAEAARDAAFERLGITTQDELDALPDATGQADAARQTAAKIKRLEADLASAAGERDKLTGDLRGLRTDAAINAALTAHDWHDRADVLARVKVGLSYTDAGDPVYTGADGKAVDIKTAVAGIATAAPHLLKPKGAGSGSGYSGERGAPGASAAPKLITRTEFDALTPQDRAAKMGEGYKIQ